MQVRWRLGHRPALDGIRGAAVFIVIADHAGFLPEPAGGIGVTLFFVLSGFLITRVIVEARDSRTWSMAGFVANRFVRLFPALAVMVAVVSGILLARGLPVRDVTARAVPALTYVQNMAPRLSFQVFGHTWSLGVEEQFYLLWPLALPWVMRRARPHVFLALVIAGSVAVEILFPRDWLPMHAYALLAGCALALRRPGPANRWMFPAGALALAVSMVLGPSFTQLYVYGPMIATPGAVLMVAGALPGNRFLEASPLRFTGRISYAAYLWHVPLLRLTGATYAGAAAIPPIVLAVIVAVASTLIIEEPARRAWRLRHSAVPATSGSLDPTGRTPSRFVRTLSNDQPSHQRGPRMVRRPVARWTRRIARNRPHSRAERSI
jgi:peptidoglycan/LPS O-acetylase OafA/YrhL